MVVNNRFDQNSHLQKEAPGCITLLAGLHGDGLQRAVAACSVTVAVFLMALIALTHSGYSGLHRLPFNEINIAV